MKIHHLAAKPSILSHFLAEIRDETIQKDRLRFRKNLERIGEVVALELSKSLSYKTLDVPTPLGTKTCSVLQDDMVICSVLRAGLPLHQGLLNYFDKASSAYISAYRKHKEGGEVFDIEVAYLAAPSLEGKILILADPMLATGKSFISVFDALKPLGTPKEIHLVSVIGAKEGIEHVAKSLPQQTRLWIADIDETLNRYGYIIPGLGDAGDLAFGEKLQH